MIRHTDEPTIMTQSMYTLPGIEETTLAEAVANGRLYILNGKGEFEQVILSSWFKQDYETGGDELLQVCSDGYEFNLDGEQTRNWKK